MQSANFENAANYLQWLLVHLDWSVAEGRRGQTSLHRTCRTSDILTWKHKKNIKRINYSKCQPNFLLKSLYTKVKLTLQSSCGMSQWMRFFNTFWAKNDFFSFLEKRLSFFLGRTTCFELSKKEKRSFLKNDSFLFKR